jgi:hypothetical protein
MIKRDFKSMKKHFCYFIALFIFFFCCNPTNAESKKVETFLKNQIENSLNESNQQKNKYSILVEKIDSVYFFQERKNAGNKESAIEKITDYNAAKKLLKGVVEFKKPGEYGDLQAVEKINFKNGTKHESPNEYDDVFFVAYFPSENILLCEGGHATDVSFNLTNGKETAEIGNPDLIVHSPRKQFRLNGYYSGQDCNFYFIQKNINGQFEKVIQLDEEFENITKKWPCTVRDFFWTDESTLYLTLIVFDKTGEKFEYYKIKIVGK